MNAIGEFIAGHAPLAVLTGAGISTGSGLPAYRAEDGTWKHPAPVQYADFMRDPRIRQRYWLRSALGWPRFALAEPNAAHTALARFEAHGWLATVITQNVDGLHQKAGSRSVVDLHGRLDTVACLACGARWPRAQWQSELLAANSGRAVARTNRSVATPDGDAEPLDADYEAFVVPACRDCGGLVKPAVVFYGESLAPAVRDAADGAMAAARGLLVIGSSLMVFSAFRLVRAAHAAGLPAAMVNLGISRADELFSLRVAADCVSVLEEACRALTLDPAPGEGER